jgi:hypothetical protein
MAQTTQVTTLFAGEHVGLYLKPSRPDTPGRAWNTTGRAVATSTSAQRR